MAKRRSHQLILLIIGFNHQTLKVEPLRFDANGVTVPLSKCVYLAVSWKISCNFLFYKLLFIFFKALSLRSIKNTAFFKPGLHFLPGTRDLCSGISMVYIPTQRSWGEKAKIIGNTYRQTCPNLNKKNIFFQISY